MTMSRVPTHHGVVALSLALLWAPIARTQTRADPARDPPQAAFQELFVAVQTAAIFPDSKTFADATPTAAPARIVAEYRRSPPRTPDALRGFVAAHFSILAEAAPWPTLDAPSPPGVPQRESLAAHIDTLWNTLKRTTPAVPPYSSLLALPYPYVVPGGRFREMYYWDSYFTLLGVMQSGRAELAEDMVRDFAYLIDTFGHVPNGTRTYYVSRSQPPFFYKMVELLDPLDPPAAYARYLAQLRREYGFWMRGAAGLQRGTARFRVVTLADGAQLNRYWDDRDTPRDEAYREDLELARRTGRDSKRLYRDIRAAAESGWDFSSRWFADGHERASIDTTDILPIDLNSLLFGLEIAISEGCARAGDARCARNFTRLGAARKAALDRHLWDPARGAYLDYRWPRARRIPRVSAATLYPLFVGLSSDAQAAAVARVAGDELLKRGGIVATPVNTGQQWDAPNGWAPLQWIAVDGLRRYRHTELAAAIACRWMSGVNQVYLDTGKLVEKYDVMEAGRRGGGGEYPTQDGFGWTNGVMRKLGALYPELEQAIDPAHCPGDGHAGRVPTMSERNEWNNATVPAW